VPPFQQLNPPTHQSQEPEKVNRRDPGQSATTCSALRPPCTRAVASSGASVSSCSTTPNSPARIAAVRRIPSCGSSDAHAADPRTRHRHDLSTRSYAAGVASVHTTTRQPPPWARLEVAAQKALLRHLARSPLAVAAPPGAPVVWVRTGVASNIHNGVAATRLTPTNADPAITDTLAHLAGQPAIWHLDTTDTPTDLPARLAAAGCRPERTAVVMGATCTRVPPPRPPTGVDLTEITAPSGVRAWRAVAGTVWTESAAPDLDTEAALYASLPLGPTHPWRHWLATDHGRPIGMISGLFTDTTVMIEHVGVAPAARGHGVGAALVTTVVADAAARGIPHAVLGPTHESRPLYQRLGFTVQTCIPDTQLYLP
jgi:GNAT superfamily N-acetyltransferase